MEHNECKNCGASGGRAGITFSSTLKGYESLCRNCKDTLSMQKIVIHAELQRTDAELFKTMKLLSGGAVRWGPPDCGGGDSSLNWKR